MNILVAGVGNIFLGDDGFGVEVVRELLRQAWPPGLRIADFGIRGYDLAFACSDGCDALVLVDAVPRGAAPGTVYLIEPDLEGIGRLEREVPDAHSLNPVHVLQMADSLGGRPDRVLLVGCEPGDLGGEDGRIGLSAAVQGAVPEAARMIRGLVTNFLDRSTATHTGPVPA